MLAYKDIKLQSRELSSPSSLPQGCRKHGRLGAGRMAPHLDIDRKTWSVYWATTLCHLCVGIQKIKIKVKKNTQLNAHAATSSRLSLNQVLIILACVELLH